MTLQEFEHKVIGNINSHNQKHEFIRRTDIFIISELIIIKLGQNFYIYTDLQPAVAGKLSHVTMVTKCHYNSVRIIS